MAQGDWVEMEIVKGSSVEREKSGNMEKKTMTSGSLEFLWLKMDAELASDSFFKGYDYSNQHAITSGSGLQKRQ
ncbi:hypothetical protein L1987_05645 [Smallanthus sonchifolius]|uniref:Uncharacterized protein n=1 Tax=Smallanthus sonchifolius TaxID=185202 RepID=A0ACB9JW33_9ASTR|nr:hypothetical protein L1987_05645 [Smallanthus sonchifolius]